MRGPGTGGVIHTDRQRTTNSRADGIPGFWGTLEESPAVLHKNNEGTELGERRTQEEKRGGYVG